MNIWCLQLEILLTCYSEIGKVSEKRRNNNLVSSRGQHVSWSYTSSGICPMATRILPSHISASSICKNFTTFFQAVQTIIFWGILRQPARWHSRYFFWANHLAIFWTWHELTWPLARWFARRPFGVVDQLTRFTTQGFICTHECEHSVWQSCLDL